MSDIKISGLRLNDSVQVPIGDKTTRFVASFDKNGDTKVWETYGITGKVLQNYILSGLTTGNGIEITTEGKTEYDKIYKLNATFDTNIFNVVTEKPNIENAESGKIYLVKNDSATGDNVYDEYILVEKDGTKHIELLGTSKIDFNANDYYNKSELEDYLKDNKYLTESNFSSYFSGYFDEYVEECEKLLTIYNTYIGEDNSYIRINDKTVNLSQYLTSSSLNGYATESWVKEQGYLTEQSLENYYTKEEIDNAIEEIDVTEQLADYAKTEDVNKEIADAVKDLASESYVDDAIKDLNIDDYAKKSETYTKGEVDSVVANVKSEILGGAGEDYDTLKEIEEWIGEHGDLYSALVTTVGEKATKDEIKDMATMSWVTEQEYLTEHQSLDAYATKEYVGQEIAKAITDGTIDLSNYVEKSDFEALKTKLSYYDQRFGYTSQEGSEPTWKVEFLRIDNNEYEQK